MSSRGLNYKQHTLNQITKLQTTVRFVGSKAMAFCMSIQHTVWQFFPPSDRYIMVFTTITNTIAAIDTASLLFAISHFLSSSMRSPVMRGHSYVGTLTWI